jgi:hypothetical protein
MVISPPPLPYWINGFFLRIYDYVLLPRFVSLFSFIVALLVTRNLMKKLGINEEKIFIFLAVMLLNPFLIYYSRIMYTDIFFFIFFWFTLLNLYIFLGTKEKKHLYHAGVSFTLLSLVKSFALVVFLPILGVLAMLTIWRKITLRELLEFTAVASIGFAYLGIVNIYAYLKTGMLSQFATFILLITNFTGITEINTQRAISGELQTYQGAEVVLGRIIHFIVYIVLYTLPFISLLVIEKIRNTKSPVFSYNQKAVLSILLLLFITIPVVRQFELRHFLVIFPIVYLFATEKFVTGKLKQAAIILIAISSIVNIYSFHMFRENPLLPDSNLHIRSDIRLRAFEYVNSHTQRHEDIVIVQGWSGEQDAYETNLFEGTLYEPPSRSKYVIYTPELSPIQEERDKIEGLLDFKDIYTLEKTFTDEFEREYYVYSINPAYWSNGGIDFYLDYRKSRHPFGRELEYKPSPTLWEVYEETGVNSPHNALAGINPLGMYPLERSLIS